MSCPKSDWIAAAKGDLPERELVHVRSCPDCSARVESTRTLLGSLNRLRERTIEPSGDFKWRVRAAFLEAHPEFLERPAPRRQGLIPAWALALVLQVQLLGIAALWLLPAGPGADPTGREIRYVRRERPPELGFHGSGRFDRSQWAAAIEENRLAGLRKTRQGAKDSRSAEAVSRALDWLAATQKPDGRWEGSTAATGLAALAMLGNGETPSTGPHAGSLKKAVDRLLAAQQNSGAIGGSLRDHMIATAALIECRLMTGDEALELPVEIAVAFILQAQGAARDPETDAWQALALRLALAAGDRSVIPALNSMRARIAPETPMGLMSSVFASPSPSKKGGHVVADDLPSRHFAALALHQAGGEAWEKFREGFRAALLKSQTEVGSWPAEAGDQTRPTALAALILESEWRYPRLMD